jgi:hypothetical protein
MMPKAERSNFAPDNPGRIRIASKEVVEQRDAYGSQSEKLDLRIGVNFGP